MFMAEKIVEQLTEYGQSVWLDSISRAMLKSGKLKKRVEQGVRGLTSNPTIFEKAITQTVFAASSNTTRPVLSGVLFKVDKDTVKLVATDSYRLAEKTLKLKTAAKFSITSLIPARTVSELGKIHKP